MKNAIAKTTVLYKSCMLKVKTRSFVFCFLVNVDEYPRGMKPRLRMQF